MEISRKWLKFYLGLLLVGLCKGFPVNFEENSNGHAQFLTCVAAILVTVGSIVLVGCLCCKRRKGFEEFHNSPVVASVASNLDHGHVNPISNGEFTIFTPLSPPHFNNNVFLANEQVIRATTEDYVYGDIDVSLWFDGNERDFPRSKLKYIRELGKGTFGKIVEGAAQDNTKAWTPVIVRILDAAANQKERALFLNDALFYLAPPHPNLLALKGRCLSAAPLLLLQESCTGGDLKRRLRHFGSEEDKILQWCLQLTSALKHLHDHGFIHPDLAARNCLLTNSLTLKLGDYNLSPLKYPEDYYRGGEPLISVRWRSPESLDCTPTTIQPKKLTKEANVWSLGVVMWEICENGAQPYENLDDDEVISRVFGSEGLRLEAPSKPQMYSDYIFRLIKMCWNNAESRPKVAQIDVMLTDLYQVHKNTQNPPLNATDDFDSRWEASKPNTIVKTDNHSTSIEGVADTVLSNKPINFKLGPSLLHATEKQADAEQIDSLTDSMIFKQQISSESDTEEENWRRKVERGAYSEKVRLKSRSVADLMVLTHVDYSESESETPLASIDFNKRKTNLESLNFTSEGNLLSIEDNFEKELKKLQVERRDSLLFVPASNKSQNNSHLSLMQELNSPQKIKPINQIYNIFTMSINSRKIPEMFSKQHNENKTDLGYATLHNSERNSDFGSIDGELILEEKCSNVDDEEIIPDSRRGSTILNSEESQIVPEFLNNSDSKHFVDNLLPEIKQNFIKGPNILENRKFFLSGDLNVFLNAERRSALDNMSGENQNILIEENSNDDAKISFAVKPEVNSEKNTERSSNFEVSSVHKEMVEEEKVASSNDHYLLNQTKNEAELEGKTSTNNESRENVSSCNEGSMIEEIASEVERIEETLTKLYETEKAVTEEKASPTLSEVDKINPLNNIEENASFIENISKTIENSLEFEQIKMPLDIKEIIKEKAHSSNSDDNDFYAETDSQIKFEIESTNTPEAEKDFSNTQKLINEETEETSLNIIMEIEPELKSSSNKLKENACPNSPEFDTEKTSSAYEVNMENINAETASLIGVELEKEDQDFSRNFEGGKTNILASNTSDINLIDAEKTHIVALDSSDINLIDENVIAKKTNILDPVSSDFNLINEKNTSPKVTFDLSTNQQEAMPNPLTHNTLFSSTPFGKKTELSLPSENAYSSINLFTLDPVNDNKEEETFSSQFTTLEENDANKLNYSLETWDNFLGKSFDSNRENNGENNMFDSFTSEPQSMLFLDDEQTYLKENNEGTFVKNNDTFVIEDKKSDATFVMTEDKQSDGTFTVEKAEENIVAEENQANCEWESGGGWFLHPQSNNDKLSGDIVPQPGTSSYVGFGMDDEIMTAIRNELLEKLPHAQGVSSQENVEEEEEEELNQTERNEVFLKYNTPLSPIPEESSFDVDNEGNTEENTAKSEIDSDDWSDQDDLELPLLSSQTIDSSHKMPSKGHSQSSCCSNDTLFNFDDFVATNEATQINENDNVFEENDVVKTESEYHSCSENNEEATETVIPEIEGNEDKSNSENDICTEKQSIEEFLLSEKNHTTSSGCSSLPFIAKMVAPLPSPEDKPWKSLPTSLLSLTVDNEPKIKEPQVLDTISSSTESKPDAVRIYENIIDSVATYENINNKSPDNTYENIISDQKSNIYDDYVNLDETKTDISINDKEISKFIDENNDRDIFGVLTDIRFSGPIDSQLMSTSFSESNDVDEQDWDSGSDTRSSSSGEFIWKEGEHEESLKALRAAPHDVLEDVKPMEEIAEETTESDVSSGTSDEEEEEEGENLEFVPSAWDKFAMPVKSALRSPEKSLDRTQSKKSKGVWFKKQKYHCVYEYPREPESPILLSQDLWKPQMDYAAFSDWDFDAETYLPPPTADGDLNPSTFTFKPKINNSRRSLYYLTSPPNDIIHEGDGFYSSSTSNTTEEDFIPNKRSSTDIYSQFFPGAWIENVTPDSGLEDSTPTEFPGGYQDVLPLKKLAAQVINKNKEPSKEPKDVLGGLRHTRSKLKLDLPPSPSAFTSNKTFTMEPIQEPIVIREKPTFSTFGKSRFLVQHIDTPTDELPQNKNVCFDVLPYKPINILPKNNVTVNETQESVTYETLKTNFESTVNKMYLKGEASLLDSADEDSGIESSTLERKLNSNVRLD